MTPDMILTFVIIFVIAIFVIAVIGMWLSYRYATRKIVKPRVNKHTARVRKEDGHNDAEH